MVDDNTELERLRAENESLREEKRLLQKKVAELYRAIDWINEVSAGKQLDAERILKLAAKDEAVAEKAKLAFQEGKKAEAHRLMGWSSGKKGGGVQKPGNKGYTRNSLLEEYYALLQGIYRFNYKELSFYGPFQRTEPFHVGGITKVFARNSLKKMIKIHDYAIGVLAKTYKKPKHTIASSIQSAIENQKMKSDTAKQALKGIMPYKGRGTRKP